MKYWIEDDKGNLELRHWCDNPDCTGYVIRGKIDIMATYLDKEFCSMYCERQYHERKKETK